MDTSDYVMGGVLSMECEDRLWRPVAFLSKSLNETKRNYEIHDKEMLAIIRELETFAGRSAIQIRDLDRSQEFRIFYESAKVEQETGQMGLIFVSV